MRAAPTIRDGQTSERGQAACAFAHALLCPSEGEESPLEQRLQEVADLFGARRAGLTSSGDRAALAVTGEEPAEGELPWEQDADLLARARREPRALLWRGEDGPPWLLSPAGPAEAGWLLWLEGTEKANWTDADAAALTLVAHALARLAETGLDARWADHLDRARAQARLEDAAIVAGSLAHEFGNVLTGILGFSELALGQQASSRTPMHTFLGEVHRSAENGARYTRHLHLFARRSTPSGKWCALEEVLAEEAARFRDQHSGDIQLYTRVPEVLPRVAIDSEGLLHIVGALLANAREALYAPGSINVSVREVQVGRAECLELFGDVRPGPHVEVVIADTGEGLSPEVQAHLFHTPFFTTKPRHRGLGLATAYGLLRVQNGGIRLYPGERGAVARVVLPQAPVGAQPEAEELAPVAGERILVVEDDPLILRLACTTLGEAGYRVRGAGSAEEALELYRNARSDPFALVLSDLVLSGATGLDLAHHLGEGEEPPRILLMSGRVNEADAREEIGDLAFLKKPFRPEGLLRAVRRVLGRRGSGLRPVVAVEG